ncbi:hypothetical protein E2C01_020839 [Portunus trituberculatus]|uniref:Uncharacterized protein n=1 Tax=Portunus trituberculatus TaxID=210409 RepID=A0A5B7E0Z6_PORTR|nr:hypothetical protein [Portunus trituberculatus]
MCKGGQETDARIQKRIVLPPRLFSKTTETFNRVLKISVLEVSGGLCSTPPKYSYQLQPYSFS